MSEPAVVLSPQRPPAELPAPRRIVVWSPNYAPELTGIPPLGYRDQLVEIEAVAVRSVPAR